MFAVQICSQLIWSHRRKFELAAPIAPSVVTLVVAGVTVAQQRVTFRHQQEVTSAEVAV